MKNSTKVTLMNNLSTILQNSNLKQSLYNNLMRPIQLKAIHDLQKIKQHTVSKVENPKKIIFHAVHGQYLGAIYRELAIAKTLQLKGHDVKVIFCGGRLLGCSGCFTKDNPLNYNQCKNCINFSKKFADTTGLPYTTYDDILPVNEDLFDRFLKLGTIYEAGKDCIEDIIYKGVKIGTHAQKSTDRYFKGEQPPDDKFLVRKLYDTTVVVDVAEQILEKEKPNIIITSHSIYAEWGSFSEFFKNHNIPVYTWFTGTVPNTLVFNFDQIGKDFDKYYKEQSLTDEQEFELKRFLYRRRKGYGDTALYTYTQEKKKLNFDGYQKVVALFPNVPWDIDTTNRTLFFDSTYEWIDFTIDLFKNKPEWLLIIKTHPYERIEKSKKSIYDYVMEKQSIPKHLGNVLVLPADTKISSYDLFPHIDVGIVSNSTTGLEMILEGIPVITVGEAHYRGKGLTYDPMTKEEYIEFLMNRLLAEPKNDLALSYAYYYFIKSYIPFDVYYKKNFLNMGWNIKSYEEFLKNKTLNHIADCIVDGKIFQDW